MNTNNIDYSRIEKFFEFSNDLSPGVVDYYDDVKKVMNVDLGITKDYTIISVDVDILEYPELFELHSNYLNSFNIKGENKEEYSWIYNNVSFGSHMFRYSKDIFIFTYCKYYSYKPKLLPFLIIKGKNRFKKFKSFVDDIAEKVFKKQQEKIDINEYKNVFKRVFLNNGIKEQIIKEVDIFLKSREIYQNDLKLPWKRGLVLYGPPGNGKTATIRAITQYFGLWKYDLVNHINQQGELSIGARMDPSGCGPASGMFSIMRYIDVVYKKEIKPKLYFIEDIDKFTATQSADQPKISLGSLLKGLDGVDELNGVLFIATTNYITEMAEALMARPGRFDSIYEFGLPQFEMRKQMFDFYNIEITNGKIDKIINELEGYSMAFVEEFIKSLLMKFKRRKVSFEETRDILQKIHDHNIKYQKHFSDAKTGFVEKV